MRDLQARAKENQGKRTDLTLESKEPEVKPQNTI